VSSSPEVLSPAGVAGSASKAEHAGIRPGSRKQAGRHPSTGAAGQRVAVTPSCAAGSHAPAHPSDPQA